MYIVVGDSHGNIFEHLEGFTVKLFLAGPTAYNIAKENSTLKTKQKIADVLNSIDKQKDTLILSFGEIDCRIHIYYQHKKQSIPMSTLIDRTVEKYGAFLDQLRVLDVKFIVCGIPPAGHQENIVANPDGTPVYPWYASPDVQADIYREFNDKMKLFCQSRGYRYLDIYSKTVGPDGHILPEYAYPADDTHLGPKAIPILLDLIAHGG